MNAIVTCQHAKHVWWYIQHVISCLLKKGFTEIQKCVVLHGVTWWNFAVSVQSFLKFDSETVKFGTIKTKTKTCLTILAIARETTCKCWVDCQKIVTPYQALLSKVLYNFCLLCTHSHARCWLTIRGKLGFSILPKDTLTCGQDGDQTSNPAIKGPPTPSLTAKPQFVNFTFLFMYWFNNTTTIDTLYK